MRGPFSCLARFVTVVVICAALIGGALWLSRGQTTPPGANIPTPMAAVAATTASSSLSTSADTNAAVTAKRKLDAAIRTAQAAPPGSHRPVTVTLTEAEVNAIAAPELANDPQFPLQQPTVHVLPGRLVVDGQAALGPATVPVAVTGTVAVQGGVPTLTIAGVQASGITAPQSMVKQLSDQLATSLRLTPADLPITVQQVTLADRSLTIAGVTK